MRYLRFGEIPENEKSINWYKVSLDDQRDFSWALENYGYKDALRQIRNLDEVMEKGVSVFELNENNQPVLNTESLKNTYNSYNDSRKMYIVVGDEIGRGVDGEPLIVNIKVLEEI